MNIAKQLIRSISERSGRACQASLLVSSRRQFVGLTAINQSQSEGKFPRESEIAIEKAKQPSKKKSCKPYVNVVVREEDLEEKFSRSSGPGGQSVNKTNSRVQLTHLPTNITVTCQEQRDLIANRKTARRKLKEELDLLYNGDNSKIMKRINKLKRRKSKARSRAKKKYGTADDNNHNPSNGGNEGIDDDDDDDDENNDQEYEENEGEDGDGKDDEDDEDEDDKKIVKKC